MTTTAETGRRNVRAEWIAIFDEADDPALPAPLVAARLVAHLAATNPDLLAEWLQENAVSIASDWLGCRRRARRSLMRANKARSAFAKVAERFASGDDHALDPFLSVSYVVGDDGASKPLGLLTRADWAYVEHDYTSRANANAFEAAVAAAIGKRLRADQVTQDVFTVEQILTLRSSIGGSAAA